MKSLIVSFSVVGLFSMVALSSRVQESQSSDSSATSYITESNNLSAKDELAIRGIIAKLNHALDAADYTLYASFFSDDGKFVSGFGTANGRKEIAAALEQSRPMITGKRHIAGNLLVSGEGDKATVTSYLVVFERDKSLTFVGSAVNTDYMIRVDGQWMVKRHDSTLDPATEAAIQAAMAQQQNK